MMTNAQNITQTKFYPQNLCVIIKKEDQRNFCQFKKIFFRTFDIKSFVLLTSRRDHEFIGEMTF